MTKLERLGYEPYDALVRPLIKKCYRKRNRNGDEFISFTNLGGVILTCEENNEIAPFYLAPKVLEAIYEELGHEKDQGKVPRGRKKQKRRNS